MKKCLLPTFFLLVWAANAFAQPSPTPNCCQTTWSYPSGNTTFGSSTDGLAYDPSGPGTLYVGGNSVIHAVHPSSGFPLNVLPGTYGSITMMTLGRDGHLYVADYSNAVVYRVQLPGGARAATFDMSFAGSGVRTVIADDQVTDPDLYVGVDSGNVYKVTQPGNSIVPLVFSPDAPGGRASVTGLLLQPGVSGAPSTLYLADAGADKLFKFVQASAGSSTYGYVLTVPLTGFSFPHQMVKDSGGNVYLCGASGYAQYDGNFQNRLKSCAATVVFNPQGLALDGEEGVYLGSLLDNGALIRLACVPSSLVYPGYDPPSSGDFFLYPSPVRGNQATLSCKMAESGEVALRIWNENGELSAEIKDHKPPGVQIVPFNASSLVPGVYSCRVDLKYDSGKKESLKLRKFAVIR